MEGTLLITYLKPPRYYIYNVWIYGYADKRRWEYMTLFRDYISSFISSYSCEPVNERL